MNYLARYQSTDATDYGRPLCQKEVTCTNHIGTIEGSDPDAGAVVIYAYYDSAPGGWPCFTTTLNG
ncbi:hypothetical protein ACFYU8_15260 [Brevibacillus sp. NPDC003359]|uniref:hypothetical protein n=1 Tax=unclassified Brevibacillus TaxID=2684853 RepID=UPI00369473DB